MFSQLQSALVLFGSVNIAVLSSILYGLGLTIPVSILTAVGGALAIGVVEMLFDAQKGWFDEHTQDLVCAIAQADDARTAYNDVVVVFEEEWGPELGNSLLARIPFYFSNLNLVFDGGIPAGDLTTYSASYCDSCGIVEGSDWYAVIVNSATTLSHPQSSAWISGCITYVGASADRCVGIVYTVAHSGTCQLKRMGADACTTCGGVPVFTNTSESLTSGLYFACQGAQINTSEAQAALAPGSTLQTTGTAGASGPNTFCFGWQNGYTCLGTDDIVASYIVFKKTV